MNQIEKNIIKSFGLAKKDIKELEGRISSLVSSQSRIKKTLGELNKRELQLYQNLQKIKTNKQKKARAKPKPKKKVIAKKKHHTIYVAPKEGKKFHLKNCPFAQNIKPKNKIVFRSKTKALNAGFRPCTCIK